MKTGYPDEERWLLQEAAVLFISRGHTHTHVLSHSSFLLFFSLLPSVSIYADGEGGPFEIGVNKSHRMRAEPQSLRGDNVSSPLKRLQGWKCY